MELSRDARKGMIAPNLDQISLARQCELLDVSRSGYYYRSAGESEYNLTLMRLIDEQYTKRPFYGSPRMTVWLRRQGHPVNEKRVARLMTLMGLQAIYPKPNLSIGNQKASKYPYLLRGVKIERPNQVWASDITYIRLSKGFIYLTAIMDWRSRYVVSWAVSISLETEFCLAALEQALQQGRPEIFNTDQGVQFTDRNFIDKLESKGILVSMDGKGRCFDNIFTERLWRTVKCEDVYLKNYESVSEAKQGLREYLEFYNNERPHQALGYRTPAEVWAQKF